MVLAWNSPMHASFLSSYVRQKAKINLIIVACLFKRLSIAITRVIYSLALPGCPLPNQNAITSKKFAHIAVLHSFNLSPQFAVWGRRKILVRTGKADIKGWGGGGCHYEKLDHGAQKRHRVQPQEDRRGTEWGHLALTIKPPDSRSNLSVLFCSCILKD